MNKTTISTRVSFIGLQKRTYTFVSGRKLTITTNKNHQSVKPHYLQYFDGKKSWSLARSNALSVLRCEREMLKKGK